MSNNIKKPLIVKAILLTVSMVSIMCTGAIAPSLPYMAKHYSYLSNSKLLMRLVVTTPHLAICCLSIPISIVLDKADKITSMTIMLVLYAALGTSCFFIENIYIIIALRAGLGICIATVLSASSTIIAEILEGQDRKKTIGLQTTAMSVGTIIFNLSSGQITDSIGWRYNFLLYSIPVIFVPLSIIYLYPIKQLVIEKQIEHKNKRMERKAKNASRRRMDAREIFIPIIILMVAFINMMMYYMIPLQMPFFLTSFPKMTAKKISLVLGLETLFSAIGGAIYSKISKKIEKFGFMGGFALLLMSSCYAIASVAPSYIAILSIMPLYGFGMGMMMPNLTMWLISASQHKKTGLFMGSFYSALYLGKFSCSILIHIINTKFKISNPRTIYLISAEIMISIALFLITFEVIEKIAQKKKAKKEITTQAA